MYRECPQREWGVSPEVVEREWFRVYLTEKVYDSIIIKLCFHFCGRSL